MYHLIKLKKKTSSKSVCNKKQNILKTKKLKPIEKNKKLK